MNFRERRRNPERIPDPPLWIAVLVLVLVIVAVGAQVCRGAERAVNPHPWHRPNWSGCTPRDHQKNCRTEILAARCTALSWSPNLSSIVSARCKDDYSGATEIRTGKKFQLDHVFPTARAWSSRTWRNSKGGICRKAQGCRSFAEFFNDPRNLFVTSLRANDQKGERGPDAWCPRSVAIRPAAARAWRYAAARYRLPFSDIEERGLEAWEAGTCLVGAREVPR